MIIISRKNNIFNRKLILFARIPKIKYGIFDNYLQSKESITSIIFKKTLKYTKIINIAKDDFQKAFDRNTSYEIRRAMKDEIICKDEIGVDMFMSFYSDYLSINDKMDRKNCISKLSILKDYLVVSAAYNKHGALLVYHSYIIDTMEKRARLFHSVSCSKISNDENIDYAEIGRANRLLHFNDMNWFKIKGIEIYDFGGYSLNTTDNKLLGINKFKDCFGGELKVEYNYESRVILIIKKVLESFRNIKKNLCAQNILFA